MKIDLYGDSTQTGVSVWSGTAYYNPITPAIMLQMVLDREYGAGTHQVTNLGVGGSSIVSALGTSIYPDGNILQSVTARHADIVIANFGINDAYIPGRTAAAHKARYETLRNHVIADGGQFIYESPNPTTSASHDPIIKELHDAVMTIPSLLVCDVRGFPLNANGQRAGILGYYPQWQAHLSDHLHPNGIMYAWIGASMLPSSVRPLL